MPVRSRSVALEQRHAEHELVASLIVPIPNVQAASAAEHRQRVRLEAGDYRALEVYCFGAETRYMTREGPRTLGETAGTTQLVLSQSFTEQAERHAGRSDGRWVEASIESFGEQPLLHVRLRRNKVRRTVRATPGHIWFAKPGNDGSSYAREIVTSDLRPGMVLASLTPRDAVRQSTPSPFGVAHGIVYGDGARKNQRGITVGTGSYVDLWGEKNLALLPYFNDSPTAPMKTPSGVDGVRVLHLPGYFKDRPDLGESVPYLYGWLAGYFAADGSVSRGGAATLSSARLDDLEFVQAVCDRLGILTGTVTTVMRLGLGLTPTPLHSLALMRQSLRPEFFAVPEHRRRFLAAGTASYARLRWTVEAVEDHGEVEEVFCAVVPGMESFALEDYLWTHNCRVCRVSFPRTESVQCTTGPHLYGGWGGPAPKVR